MAREKIILITNDDGITSKGIRALVDAAREYGKPIVVAPDSPQSGMGHAVTLTKPLRTKKEDLFDGVEAYSCSGTPVDCVKWGVHHLLGNVLPDLCLSGINHGANNSINVLYSGTMSAAMEGAIQGIPSIGFSSLDYTPDGDMTTAAVIVRRVLDRVVANGMPASKLLNVNIPFLPLEEIRDIRICRQANARWVEEFDETEDVLGQKEFKISGKFVLNDDGEDTCVWALKNGFVSVVPVQFDLTSYPDLELLKNNWNKNG